MGGSWFHLRPKYRLFESPLVSALKLPPKKQLLTATRHYACYCSSGRREQGFINDVKLPCNSYWKPKGNSATSRRSNRPNYRRNLPQLSVSILQNEGRSFCVHFIWELHLHRWKWGCLLRLLNQQDRQWLDYRVVLQWLVLNGRHWKHRHPEHLDACLQPN